MGVCLTNKVDSVSMSYFTFGIIRMIIADAFDPQVGHIYEKIYQQPHELTDDEKEYLDRSLPKYLNLFLFHSDCEGHFSSGDVKKIYNELVKLKPRFQGYFYEQLYKRLLELFSQGERIDLY